MQIILLQSMNVVVDPVKVVKIQLITTAKEHGIIMCVLLLTL